MERNGPPPAIVPLAVPRSPTRFLVSMDGLIYQKRNHVAVEDRLRGTRLF